MCGTACEASLFMSGAATAQTAGRNREAPSPCTRNGLWKRSRSAGRSRTTTDAGFALGAGHVSSILPDPGDSHVEIRIGTLDDAPFNLKPEAEIWTKRRETWLPPVDGATQHEHNR